MDTTENITDIMFNVTSNWLGDDNTASVNEDLSDNNYQFSLVDGCQVSSDRVKVYIQALALTIMLSLHLLQD